MTEKKFHQGTENLKKNIPDGRNTAKLVDFNQTENSRNQTFYRTEELRPWMKSYASWMALHESIQLPGIRQRIKKVKGMCRGKLNAAGLKYLESRQDFQNLVEELKRDELKRARLHAEIYAVEMVDIHREAAMGLMAEGKFDKIAPLTTPYLDRVWPKSDENQQQAQVIQINLEGSYAKRQIATLDDEDIPTVEATEIQETEEGNDL